MSIPRLLLHKWRLSHTPPCFWLLPPLLLSAAVPHLHWGSDPAGPQHSQATTHIAASNRSIQTTADGPAAVAHGSGQHHGEQRLLQLLLLRGSLGLLLLLLGVGGVVGLALLLPGLLEKSQQQCGHLRASNHSLSSG